MKTRHFIAGLIFAALLATLVFQSCQNQDAYAQAPTITVEVLAPLSGYIAWELPSSVYACVYVDNHVIQETCGLGSGDLYVGPAYGTTDYRYALHGGKIIKLEGQFFYGQTIVPDISFITLPIILR